jgi:hypothetical protein
MQILRSFLALIAGFLTMAVIVGVITAVLVKRAPHWVGSTSNPNTSYIIVNLGYSLIAAMAGGFVTAWIAQGWITSGRPIIHVLVLAIIVLLMSGLSALQQRGMQPIWYQLLLMAMMPFGVFLGGLLRLKL